MTNTHPRDARPAIGSFVGVSDPEAGGVFLAQVVRHGRDRAGIYTEVRFVSGETERVHRSYLRSVSEVTR